MKVHQDAWWEWLALAWPDFAAKIRAVRPSKSQTLVWKRLKKRSLDVSLLELLHARAQLWPPNTRALSSISPHTPLQYNNLGNLRIIWQSRNTIQRKRICIDPAKWKRGVRFSMFNCIKLRTEQVAPAEQTVYSNCLPVARAGRCQQRLNLPSMYHKHVSEPQNHQKWKFSKHDYGAMVLMSFFASLSIFILSIVSQGIKVCARECNWLLIKSEMCSPCSCMQLHLDD